MHGLRGVELFEPVLIGDMHKAYNVACEELGLSSTCDKATTLVATKVVDLAKAGARSDELTAQTLRFFEKPRAAEKQDGVGNDGRRTQRRDPCAPSMPDQP
jgi:hypothetical protein